MPLKLIFWCAIAVVVYVYLGYPLVLALMRVLMRRPVRKAAIEPTVSLLIPAYNEADVIEAKIKNALALDYPADKLEIVVASDGSSDGTAAMAEKLADGKRVKVLAYPVNRGKIAVLNDSVPRLRGDIIVFSDAAAMMQPDTLRQLVANFADPRVGAAGGVYKIAKTDTSELGGQEDLYWKYETMLKRMEADLDSVLGLHGQIHALRRELYPAPPPGTINDDYVIPVRVLQQGYRVAYDPSAVVYEEAHEMTGFGRRVRIMAGNLQQLRELRPLVWPFRPLPLFFFLSHKVGRLAVPFCMLIAILTNLLLLREPLYRVLFLAEAMFYMLATWGALRSLYPKALRLPYYFCMINAATFAGVYHALTGRRQMSWK